jgi:transposase
MTKTYRPYEPNQSFLLPVSLREWLPTDHLAYFLSDVVDALDLVVIEARYEAEERGYPPYHPRMLVKVLLYAYCVGVPSSRKIAQRLREDIAFRVLAANNTPDFRTIADFRKEHLTALAGLFLQVLRLCREAGLVRLGHVALDGTKVKANASPHKAMSYGRMREEEARLAREVQELLRQAEEADAEEDRRYGSDRRGDELPAELAFRESRLRTIREAKAALEAEARGEAEQARAAGREHPGVPAEKAQRNFTDPDSRIMPAPGGKTFVQAYNAQAAVDSAYQVIVAAEVTTEPNDKGQALPLVEAIRANTGRLPRELSADAGYFAAPMVAALEERGVEPFIPPDKTRHHVPIPPAPRGRIPQALSLPDRMRRKLRTQRGRRRYALRMETVEPVFGQIKQGRGFRQFLLRGWGKVQGEWTLICTGHNLLKLFGVWQRGGLPTLPAPPVPS